MYLVHNFLSFDVIIGQYCNKHDHLIHLLFNFIEPETENDESFEEMLIHFFVAFKYIVLKNYFVFTFFIRSGGRNEFEGFSGQGSLTGYQQKGSHLVSSLDN